MFGKEERWQSRDQIKHDCVMLIFVISQSNIVVHCAKCTSMHKNMAQL